MDDTQNYLNQVIQFIGGPLLEVAQSSATKSSLGQKDPAVRDLKQAEIVANLLKMSVKMAMSIIKMMDLDEDDESKGGGDSGDAVRLSFTSLAAKMIANAYKTGGKLPDDAATQKMLMSVEAVLNFSENFGDRDKAVKRIENLFGDQLIVDEFQMFAHTVNLYTPIINAVNNYSFGRNENQMIKETIQQLQQRTNIVREALFHNMDNESDNPLLEITLQRTLVDFYVSAHESETAYILTLSPAELERYPTDSMGYLSTENVWLGVDRCLGMLDELCQALFPDIEMDLSEIGLQALEMSDAGLQQNTIELAAAQDNLRLNQGRKSGGKSGDSSSGDSGAGDTQATEIAKPNPVDFFSTKK